jgi:hypothetical protein
MSVEDKILDVIADVDPFPAKPGGLIDQHRKAEEAKKAAAEQRKHDAEDISGRASKAVHVAEEMPESGNAFTMVVSQARGIESLIGADPLRRRATIITLDAAIVLAPTLASASDSNNAIVGTAASNVNASGFVLPINVPLVLEDRSEWFVLAASATATRVSVLTESYAAGA